MGARPDDYVPRLARNELFYFVARVCMIVSMPLVGFFGSRIISQADALQTIVAQQNTDLKVLGFKLDADIGKLSDHELRLRALEQRH